MTERYMITDTMSLAGDSVAQVSVQRPSKLSSEELEDVLAWMELLIRRIKRSGEPLATVPEDGTVAR